MSSTTDIKHYVNEIGTQIIVNCGEDISAATTVILEVRKPDGTLVEWIPAVYNTTYLLYIIVAGDFDQAGLYAMQSYVVLPEWTGRGQTATFYIYDYFDADNNPTCEA